MAEGGLRRLKRVRALPPSPEPERLLCQHGPATVEAPPTPSDGTEDSAKPWPKRIKTAAAEEPVMVGLFPELQLAGTRELCLQGTFLGLPGIRRLAAAISAAPCILTSLALGDNGIGPSGADVLAKALMQNASIKHLALSENQIRDEGATCIAACLEMQSALQQLELPLNGIRNQGAEKLATALQKNTTLRSLSLFGNRIGQGGIQCFAKLLRKNRSLTSLELWDNSGWNEDAKDGRLIKKALKKNRALQKQALKISDLAPCRPSAVVREADMSTFCAVMEATSALLAFLSLPLLFRVSGCARAARAEVSRGTWRLKHLCNSLDYKVFESSLQDESAEDISPSRGTRRLVARRSCTKMPVHDRFLRMLQLPTVQPHVRELFLDGAPTHFVRSPGLWDALRPLKALEAVPSYPQTGWPDPSTRTRFQRALDELVATLKRDREEKVDA